MNIAIIGAGFTGLTAGLRLLQAGHRVTIIEKAEQPGGLALGFTKPQWKWTVEEYYHHWFTNDKAVLSLAAELQYPVVIARPKTSVFVDQKIYQLDSPTKLLTFPKLSVSQRLQMAFVLGALRYDPFWKPLERVRAAEFLSKSMGKKGYKMIWEPQLRNKFGDYMQEISLAWFWARIAKRTSSLAYPEKGFLPFAQTLADHITKLGGKIIYSTSIEKIEKKDTSFSLGKEFGEFDKVLVTLPSFAFLKLFPQLPEPYKKKLQPLKGLGAQTVVLRLKEQFFTDGTYWLSVCDTSSPVLAIVEHTNFMDKQYYNNEHIVYLGNYLPQGHPNFSKTTKELLQLFDPYLKKLNHTYDKHIIAADMFSVPFAQPIVPVNYSKMIPSIQTPVPGLYLANMQQVYPWDRGTNYA
ncbi:MAG: FAD-dependent oxidoreductase, partial [Patescibacteria group bacterium]|nr:FAD-dependent oxidoreductase [Patescibacteria group bacterium]